MKEDGHWLVPHRHGEYYAHKPPLMFWLVNLGGWLTGTGVNSVTTRLPSLLGGVTALWCVAMLLRRWDRADQAWTGVLVCASTYLFWKEGGWGQMDMLLCGFQMLALYCLFAQDHSRSSRQALLAYASMGLAVLAKGPVGLLVPMGAYLSAKLAARESRDLRRWHWVWGPALALALPGLWLLLVWMNNPPPGYLQELLFAQNIDRARGDFGHQRPFTYFAVMLPIDGLPWTLFLPLVWKALSGSQEDRRLRARITGWVLFVVGFFTLSASKRNLYILLCYPALAILTALAWDRVRSSRVSNGLALALTWIPPVTAAVLLGAGLFASWLHPNLPMHLQGGLFAAPCIALVVWLTRHPARRNATQDVDPTPPPRLATATHGTQAQPINHVRFYTRSGLRSLAIPWLALLGSVGAFVLPGLNEHKTPRELIPLVEGRLQPGQPLILYRIQGEIQALYAGVRGSFVRDETALFQLVKTRESGLIVAEKGRGRTTAPCPIPLQALPNEQHGDFAMGSKVMCWATWSNTCLPGPVSDLKP
jgi:4-amino-4-deoxy-L-arabinose transferase-like glycosyltransferase